ncbi:MAG TPA: DNA repair protein RecN [Syntrophomonas sp.]|jgi:DNA repair protein RecN (Recombination protein N)|nr:DNA repair protein RecN [Syntrophomonas sp.]HCF71781.1 DNA repair protein RecN [Syntrophomonas sp.]
MLLEIYINNFVLIDEMRLEFGPGLNVLTGETGAGKSIIIDALSLIMGDRMKTDFVRDTSRKAIAEAVFDIEDEARSFLLNNELIENEDDSIIISREILPSGRSSARINGRNVPLGVLKTLSVLLLDMHLQHDNQNILRPEKYLDYVDSLQDMTAELTEVKRLYEDWQEQQRRLDELKHNVKNSRQKLEIIDYQIKEIEKAHLQSGEEEELVKLREKINNAARLMDGAVKILRLLYDGEEGSPANDLVAEALDTARSLEEYDVFAAMVAPLEQFYYSLQDMAASLSSYRDSLDFEPGLQDQVEERLFEINRVKNKYGSNVDEILALLANLKSEREELDVSEGRQARLAKELEQSRSRYLDAAQKVTVLRKQAAGHLEKVMQHELSQLNMPQVQFAVAVNPASRPGPRGMDEVEFTFSPNPGQPLLPVAQIASGGEISRFILALKAALAEFYQIDTLIFDEIDVGLGGSALNTTARKLSEIAQHHQVIAITHSPRVASYADHHFLIEKHINNNHTYTVVTRLDDDKRAAELARMLDGDNYTPLTLQHAQEMLNEARNE